MADHSSDATVGGTLELEVVARMDDRPGNPALTPDGRLIVSLHPFPYDELHRIITIPPHAGRPGSLQQDFAIDEVWRAIFIADLNMHGALHGPRDPAIVAVDLKTGRVRRAHLGHHSLHPEEDVSLEVEGLRYAPRTLKGRWNNRSWASIPSS
jgi:hypothetical protein